MPTDFKAELTDRLTRYCAIDSQSDERSPTSPSTDIQFEMLNLLRDELEGIGAEDVQLTDYGVVLATIPSTTDADTPTIGLLAHVDTAPQFNATGVKPVVHRAYNGGTISFADAPELELSPEGSPHLANCVGHDIVTASGTTLLGADDKAGVAIIMTAARHLLENPSIPHGKLRIAFTPDEEIGRGVNEQLPTDLAADFAFTFDGQEPGGLEVETFSADGAVVTIEGVSIHPGNAKGKLVNALHLAAKIVDTLPQARLTPETTEGREGFIFVGELTGSAAHAEIKLILRDFEMDKLAAHGDLLRQVCTTVQLAEPRAAITCEITPQYRNMAYWLDDDPRAAELARAAYRACGIEPLSVPIRGGTDGSRLTEMGVPTPNLFTGMQDIHGPLEWISVQDMEAAAGVCLKLAELGAGG